MNCLLQKGDEIIIDEAKLPLTSQIHDMPAAVMLSAGWLSFRADPWIMPPVRCWKVHHGSPISRGAKGGTPEMELNNTIESIDVAF